MDIMTKTQKELLAAMIAAVKTGTWTDVSRPMLGVTVRHKIEQPTPDYVTKAMWPGQTYSSCCFLTFTGRTVIMRMSIAPWVNSSEFPVPYWLALAVLADPSLGYDSHRQLELRNERRRRAPGEGLRQAQVTP